MNFKGKLLVASPKITDPIFAGSVIFVTKHDEEGISGLILNGPEVGEVAFGAVDKKGELPESVEDVKDKVKSGEVTSITMRLGGPLGMQGSLFMVHAYEQFTKDDENMEITPFTPGQDEDDEEDEGDDSYEIGMDFDKDERPETFGTLAEAKGEDPEIIPGVYFGGPQVLVRIFSAGFSEDKKFRFFTGMSGWAPGQLESEIEAGAWEVRDANPDLIFDFDKIEEIAPMQTVKKKFGFDPSNN